MFGLSLKQLIVPCLPVSDPSWAHSSIHDPFSADLLFLTRLCPFSHPLRGDFANWQE